MLREEQRLGEEVRRLLAEAQQTDKDEDKRYGRNRRGDELPAELGRRGAGCLRAAQDHSRAGLRAAQTGAGLPTLPASRPRQGPRRMSAGLRPHNVLKLHRACTA